MSEKRRGGLIVIAILKFVNVALFLLLIFGVLKLLDKDVSDEVTHWLQLCRLDPENTFLSGVLEKLDVVHNRELKGVGALSAFWAILFTVEGVGLLLGKVWAEWLTVIATSLFIPLEVYEIVRQTSALKICVLIINVAVVAYLIWRLLQKRSPRRKPA